MLKIKNILLGILIFSLVFGSIACVFSAENNTNITNDNSGDNNINDNNDKGSNDFDNMNFNWLMFQGNQFHTGFLNEDGTHVPNIWIFGIRSPIKSTPVVKDANIYIIGAKGLLKFINMETGAEDEDYQFDGDVTASLILKNDTIFVSSESGYIYAYNIKDKKLEWKFNTESPIKSTPAING